jgi:hypothetical protein
VIRLPILTLLAAASLIAAGCGGGGEPEGVEPEAWAADVCGALASWQQTLQDKAQTLTQEVLGASSPEAAKEEIGVFLDDVIADTETMIESFDDAGVPALEQGDELRNDFRAGLEQMLDAFESARVQVEDVPTDDPQAFQEQLTEIGTSLQTQGESIGETMESLDEKYDADELNQAFDENEQCREFQR